MTSAGGLLGAEAAADLPWPCCSSGLLAASAPVRRRAAAAGFADAVTFDMGGAGGGSLAGLDAGGALVVGRIPPGLAFGGLDTLDRGAAEAALARAGVSAEGVVAVVDAAMERAVRAVSVERGVDPAGLALVAFGNRGA